MRRSGSSWVEVDTIRRRSGSSWITVYQSYTPLSVTANNVFVTMPVGHVGPVTGTSIATVQGGKGTISYSWVLQSGTPLLSGSSTSSSAFFSHEFRLGNGTVSATYRVTVSDGISSAYTDVAVTLTVGQPL